MSDELTPKEKGALKEFYEAVAKDLASGVSKKKIIKYLVRAGWEKEIATEFVNSVENKIEQEVEKFKETPDGKIVMKKMYGRHMLYGVLWVIGGTLFSYFTYISAVTKPGGGTYTIWYGAVLYGIYKFIRSFWEWMKYNK